MDKLKNYVTDLKKISGKKLYDQAMLYAPFYRLSKSN